MEFKAGDFVKIKDGCTGTLSGHIYPLHYGDKNGISTNSLWAWDETLDGSGCSCINNWELVSSQKNTMQSLSAKLKRIFSPSLQKQYKAELIDNCGELTQKGREEIDMLVRDLVEKQFTERAEEILKEEKENK